MSQSCTETRLETLPTEILRMIIDLLLTREIKPLSCASKRLREACLPSLFRRVEFEFSRAGFDGLKLLLRSDARYYVTSFNYAVPELLETSKRLLWQDDFALTEATELLDFNFIKSYAFIRGSKESNDGYDGGYDDQHDDGPDDGYDDQHDDGGMALYNTIHSMCEEQRDIVDEGTDLMVLSSVLGGLPRLTEVMLHLCVTVKEKDWLEALAFFPLMTMSKKSCEHHIRVVSNAIRSARNKGVFIHTIGLVGFGLEYYNPLKEPDLSTLSRSLKELLDDIQTLWLFGSRSPLELLSHCALNLHQVDMSSLVVPHSTLKDFLETNKNSIRSIGFNYVKIAESRLLKKELPELSASMLCSMLNVPPSTPCQAAGRGWRLLLNDNHPRCSVGTLTKRKFSEI